MQFPIDALHRALQVHVHVHQPAQPIMQPTFETAPTGPLKLELLEDALRAMAEQPRLLPG